MKSQTEQVKPVEIEELMMEHTKLTRELRLLVEENDKYRGETEYCLQRQQEMINCLRQEEKDLAKDNKLAGNKSLQCWDGSNTSILSELLEEELRVSSTINDSDQSISDLKDRIKEMRAQTDSLRKSMGGEKESEYKTKMMAKLVRVMENRLNQGAFRFNMALEENKRMREEIQHIRIQRKGFDMLQHKLLRAFKSGRARKEKLTVMGTECFARRDEAVHRMQNLRDRQDREVARYTASMRDLLRGIDYDKEYKDFMSSKTEDRSGISAAAVHARLTKRLNAHVKALDAEVSGYEKLFTELQQVSQCLTVSEMVEKFIRIEDQNFAAFNFVKDQSNAMQVLENEIRDFTINTKHIVESNWRKEEQFQASVAQVERLVQDKLSVHQACQQSLAKQSPIIDLVIPKVDSILTELEVPRAAVYAQLGGTVISAHNLLAHLSLIEQRANEMLQAWSFSLLKVDPTAPADQQKPIFTFATLAQTTLSLLASRPAPQIDELQALPEEARQSPAAGEDQLIRPMSRSEIFHATSSQLQKTMAN